MKDTLTSCVECEGAAALRDWFLWGIGRLAAKRSTSALDWVMTIIPDSLSGETIGAHRMACIPCGKRQSRPCPRRAGNAMSCESKREKLHRRMAWKADHHHLSPPRKTPYHCSPLRGTSLRTYASHMPLVYGDMVWTGQLIHVCMWVRLHRIPG